MTKGECPSRIENWLKSEIWFSPCDLDETIDPNEGQPVFVPFYLFEVTMHSRYTVETRPTKSKALLSSSTEPGPEWVKSMGEIDNEFQEILVPATFSINQQLLIKLIEKETKLLRQSKKPFTPLYSQRATLFQADNPPSVLSADGARLISIDIDKDEAWKQIYESKVEKYIRKEIVKQIYASQQTYLPSFVGTWQLEMKNLQVTLNNIMKMDSLIFLPIYLSDYKYAGNVYELMISAGLHPKTVEGYRPVGAGTVGKMVKSTMEFIKNAGSNRTSGPILS